MSCHTIQYLVDSLEVTAYIHLILSLLEVEVNEVNQYSRTPGPDILEKERARVSKKGIYRV